MDNIEEAPDKKTIALNVLTERMNAVGNDLDFISQRVNGLETTILKELDNQLVEIEKMKEQMRKKTILYSLGLVAIGILDSLIILL